jgi:signal transduction histidine kinase
LIIGNNKGLEVSYYFDPNADCIIIGDELRLKQVLNNLIDNAVKFTEKGYISFRISKISNEDDKVKIKFTIKDTGIGIEDSVKDKIFNVFDQGDITTRKKYMGTGLGLAISKKLSKMMNGNISFESTVGNGTTFFFNCEFKSVKETKIELAKNNED